MSLTAYRGLLAVGRLLGDPVLVHEALLRLGAFAERGFYHDGFWRQASATAHQRVVGLFEGWIDPLLIGSGGPGTPGARLRRGADARAARGASAVTFTEPGAADVLRASLPPAGAEAVPRHPALLGGAGLARLALGAGPGCARPRAPRSRCPRRAALSAAGHPPLVRRPSGARRPRRAPPTANGWDRATCQPQYGRRRRAEPAREHRPGAGTRPGWPVPLLRGRSRLPGGHARRPERLSPVDDPLPPDADRGDGGDHPLCRERVRGPRRTPARPALPRGGRRRRRPGKCRPPWEAAPASLLPPSITYIPGARAEEGRWFVQAYGELALQGQLRLSKPATARLNRPDGPGARLHVLGDMPLVAYTRTEPRPHRRHERRPRAGPA